MVTSTSSIDQLLSTAQTMQVATVHNGMPWVATVYFVADEQQNVYWLSWPSRRHSQEIAINNTVAVAIQIKADMPVIGLQAEGRAERIIDESVVAKIVPVYVAKYGTGTQFHTNFVAGTAKHALYKFTPEHWILFDES